MFYRAKMIFLHLLADAKSLPMRSSTIALFFLALSHWAYAQEPGTPAEPDTLMKEAVVKFHDSRIPNLLKQAKAGKSTLQGFRVQLYNGNKADAQKLRAQFVTTYPNMSAYLLYITPEYRVQAGDFRDRFEAEKALHDVIAAFPGAFVVPAEINWPELHTPPISVE